MLDVYEMPGNGQKAEIVKKLFEMDELYDHDSGETMDSLLWG